MAKRVQVGRLSSESRTEFWREISWRVGDEHASRICWWLDVYCRWTGLDPLKFHGAVPR